MFAYKLSTPLPLLEKMYMYDIVLEYKELENIMKEENGEGGESENVYKNKMDEYKSDMDSQMDKYKSQIPSIPSTSSLPSISNFGNLQNSFKMPKI